MSSGGGKCNLCGEPGRRLLQAGPVPPLQNRFYASLEAARSAASSECEFLWCDTCSHVSVSKTRSSAFDENYDNSQTASAVAQQQHAAVVGDIQRWIPDRGAFILEIGCGRGELLDMLKDAGYQNLKGYDPAAPANTAAVVKGYWGGSGGGDPPCDLLVARHTLEEVPSPSSFVAAMAASLAPEGHVYCEITNANHLMDAEGLFSLYPECSNLFSVRSLSGVFARNGLSIEGVSSHNRGEWLGVWGRKLSVPSERAVMNSLEVLAQRIARLPRPLVLWGAGGRGGNILAFMRIDRSLIEHVVDVSKKKWGMFMPPYGQEIVAPGDLGRIAPRTILVANRKYKEEISAMAPAGCRVVAIDDLATRLDGET